MTAGVIVMVSIQPGADAALSSLPTPVQPSASAVSSVIFNPYGDAVAGSFQPRDLALDGLPSFFGAEPPIAMTVPVPDLPDTAPRSTAALPADPMVAARPPMPMGTLDPTPQVVIPDDREDVAAIANEAAPGFESKAAPEAGIKVEPNVELKTEPKVEPKLEPKAEPRQALIAPRAPAVAKDSVTSRRKARRPQPRIDRIEFAGPSGAPFAHTRFCLKHPEECRVRKVVFRGGPIELSPARRQELLRINAEVNRSIIGTPMNEPVAQEQWVISPKIGDCNDYAVTKRHKLIARGWPARALLLAEVVTTWGEHHLVLVVRTKQGDFVADNLNENLHTWSRTPYEWVRVESPVNPLFWSKIKAPRPDLVAMNGSARRGE